MSDNDHFVSLVYRLDCGDHFRVDAEASYLTTIVRCANTDHVTNLEGQEGRKHRLVQNESYCINPDNGLCHYHKLLFAKTRGGICNENS